MVKSLSERQIADKESLGLRLLDSHEELKQLFQNTQLKCTDMETLFMKKDSDIERIVLG